MNLDDIIIHLPLVGNTYRRIYNYFRRNIALTDAFHVLIGIGLGLLIGGAYVQISLFLLAMGGLYHLYAFMKG